MPRYDLATFAKRQRPGSRKQSITLRPVVAPAMLATDLYRSVYAPIIAVWQEHSARIADEYARTLAEMTQDSPADIQGAIDAAEQSASSLYLTLTPSLRNWVLKVEQAVRTRWRGSVLSATGVDLSTLLGPADMRETMEAILARNAALVKDVSAQTQARITDAVFRGLTARTPAGDVAKQIAEAVGMARDRAKRIASHQLTAASSALAQERRREAGLSVFAWHHSAKKHPRAAHLARDGHLYSEDRTLVGKKVEGKTVEAAPSPETRAGIEPYCGCTERAVMVFEFDE